MKIVVWRRVAELQVKKGLQKDAANSYRRATATILDDLGTTRYVTEVEAIAALGESMRQNGFDAEGRKAILEAVSMIDQIPERQADGRIQAGILLSKTLWRSGMHADAKQQILRAYRAANTYSDKVGIRKVICYPQSDKPPPYLFPKSVPTSLRRHLARVGCSVRSIPSNSSEETRSG